MLTTTGVASWAVRARLYVAPIAAVRTSVGYSSASSAPNPAVQPDPTPSANITVQKIAWVREAAGERMESIELTTLVYEISVTDDRAGRIEQLLDEWDLSREEIATSPYMFIGSVDEIVEQLQARRERLGISYITLFEPNAERFAPVVAHLAGA